MTTSIRALIVEDSEDDAKLVLRCLRSGGYDPQWTRVDSPEGLTSALEGHAWDVIICDYSLPHMDGLRALKIVQEGGRDIPFIIVSGKIGEDTAVAAMKAGAHDYVMKDKLDRLPAAVERELRDAGVRAQHKQLEREVREKERYYRSLMYSMHEDIVVIDPDYVITDINNSFLQTTGMARDEVIGKHCYEVSHGYSEPCDRHGEQCVLQEVFETGEPRSVQHVHKRTDGSSVHVAILLSSMKDEGGKVTHVIEAMRDVTDIMSAQETLRERVKEQTCLYAVSRDVQKDQSVDKLLQRVVEHLIPAMQFPDHRASD